MGLNIKLDKYKNEFYGIESISCQKKVIGNFPEKSLFFIKLTGIEEKLISVRLPLIKSLSSNQYESLFFSGKIDLSFTEIKASVELKIFKEIFAVEMILNVETADDLAGRVEFIICLDGEENWLCNFYPGAEGSKDLPEDLDKYIRVGNLPLTSTWKRKLFAYCGVPAVLLRNKDKNISCLFGLRRDFDYGKPLDWKEYLNVELESGKILKIVSNVEKGVLKKDVKYSLPLQLIVSNNQNTYLQVYDLIKAWCSINNYKSEVIPHKFFRTEKDIFEFLVNERRKNRFYKKGVTYICDCDRLKIFGINVTNTPFNIYLDYHLWKHTGEKIWMKRVEEQLLWLKNMRVNDKKNLNYGAFYPVSIDGKTPGFYYLFEEFEVEPNAKSAYWLLKLANEIGKDSLKINVSTDEIIEMALETLEWVIKQQQPDGSIPQKVSKKGQVIQPVTPGYSLLLFRYAYLCTGEKKYLSCMERCEKWTIENCVKPLKFFGAHPDLHPEEYEEGSIYLVLEYFLERYNDTKEKIYLDIAICLASFGFLMRCPKQLSWVKEPTWGCSAEQSHYLQYSLYSYCNLKYLCLKKLTDLTGDKFWEKEAKDLIKQSAHAVVLKGKWKGGYYERISDPWNARMLSTNNIYFSKLAPELIYQILKLEEIEK